MDRRLATISMLVALALGSAACSKEDDAAERRAAEAEAAASLPSEPATLPTAESAESLPTADAVGPPATLPVEFTVDAVPVTSVALPPFPFFEDPDGLVNDLQGPKAQRAFDRHWFIAGSAARTEEGKIALAQYNLAFQESGRTYTALEFQRNFQEAIEALGGRKVSAVQFTPDVVQAAGGREAIERNFAGAPPVPDAEHGTYLIRTTDREYWIHVSSGGTVPLMGFVTVLEKQAMQSSLGFLDAAAMKKELDASGRVALYINFDLDKATLRPDAQKVIEEINRLLVADPSLRLSIEGHTDGTGSAERNRELAGARARSVLGALVGLGVDPARLASRGFGPDKPIADNATDAGRAKNRRVELVKIS